MGKIHSARLVSSKAKMYPEPKILQISPQTNTFVFLCVPFVFPLCSLLAIKRAKFHLLSTIIGRVDLFSYALLLILQLMTASNLCQFMNKYYSQIKQLLIIITIHRWNWARTMAVKNAEHSGVGFVEIYTIFLTQGTFYLWDRCIR